MASKMENEVKRGRGRPKAFDREMAVQAAMMLFWERGYEGTSFDDLTAAMGINPSSFRNTFKSKEALYREATEVYVAEAGTWFYDILSGETQVRQAFLRLLAETAERYTRANLPNGCMVSLAATHAPIGMAALKEMMTVHRAAAETAMAERLRQGQRDGQIGDEVDPLALAAFFNTVFRGMAVQARDGAPTARLLDIGRLAMCAFPPLK